MEGDIIDGLGNNEDSRHLPDEHDTVVLSCPEASHRGSNKLLAHYADSIEMLSTWFRNRIDHYTPRLYRWDPGCKQGRGQRDPAMKRKD